MKTNALKTNGPVPRTVMLRIWLYRHLDALKTDMYTDTKRIEVLNQLALRVLNTPDISAEWTQDPVPLLEAEYWYYERIDGIGPQVYVIYGDNFEANGVGYRSVDPIKVGMEDYHSA